MHRLHFYYVRFLSSERHFLCTKFQLLGFSSPICRFCLLIRTRFQNFDFLLESIRILLKLSKELSHIMFGVRSCVVLVVLVLVALEWMQYCLFQILQQSSHLELEAHMVYIVESFQILIHFHHLNTVFLVRQGDW